MDEKHYQLLKPIEVAYRKMLREIKKSNLDIATAPPAVRAAWLNLHQTALAVVWHERQKKRAERKIKRNAEGALSLKKIEG